ncbi:MAG: UDP-N-acetyl-D-glucosamine 6-dehydrogenase [Smithella sp. PtaU1.Bin162]|nr:MAG: UDP-N-acetyl-D-glucosamine 6-dehydrogenase [Smithella sp. PtaU1.Bin162]
MQYLENQHKVKVCSRCGVKYKLDNFYYQSRANNVLRSECKDCSKGYVTRRRQLRKINLAGDSNEHCQQLLDKIKSKKAMLGIIGLGYIGLPLVAEFCKAGFHVTGFDISREKVESLNAGKSCIRQIDINQIPMGMFRATGDFKLLGKMDCILITVPTPLGKNREPDMSYIFETVRSISRTLKKGQLIVLESTTCPGTTNGEVRDILESEGLKAGEDFFLAYSPARGDPSNKDYNIRTTPKVVGGFTNKCLVAADTLYNSIVGRTIPVSSTSVAESSKLLENTYQAVNIALVNEMKMIFDRMGINIWEVIEAARTKPFGFQAFYPGPGLGGHCIPVDPYYLAWKAREYGYTTKFIELAGDINTLMDEYVVDKVIKALNDHGKHVKGSKIMILGLAYKANADDDQESPSYRLMEKLEELGGVVDYNDPHISVIRSNGEYSKFSGRKSVPLSKNYDLILIATAHDEYKKIDLRKLNIPIVDTRRIIKENYRKLYLA